jgi:hypothetical protein
MIEIKLTEEDAIKYLQTQNPDIATLTKSLETAVAYIEVLERNKTLHDEHYDNVDRPERHNIAGGMNKPAGVSSRIQREAAIVKDLAIGTKWKQWEYDALDYAAHAAQHKTVANSLKSVIHKIPQRSMTAIRKKLNERGISVIQGFLVPQTNVE